MQMIQDIENFIHQIELIKRSEARLYQFLEQMPVGVFIIDKEYNIVFSNQRSNEILGWNTLQNQDFSKIKNFLEIFKAYNYHEYCLHELPLVRSLKGEKVITEDIIITNSRGQTYQLRVLTTPIYNSNDEVEYALAVYDVLPCTSNSILSDLLQFECHKKSFKEFHQFITTLLCKRLNLSRVGIWVDYNSYIECLDIYDYEKDEHQSGMQLSKKDHPVYFEYITKEPFLAIENARMHEATREFAEDYFALLQIYSTLDCPVYVNNHLYAIICCEVAHQIRKWNSYEIDLVKSFSILVGMLIEKYYLQ